MFRLSIIFKIRVACPKCEKQFIEKYSPEWWPNKKKAKWRFGRQNYSKIWMCHFGSIFNHCAYSPPCSLARENWINDTRASARVAMASTCKWWISGCAKNSFLAWMFFPICATFLKVYFFNWTIEAVATTQQEMLEWLWSMLWKTWFLH